MKSSCVSLLVSALLSICSVTSLVGEDLQRSPAVEQVIYWNELALRTSLEAGLNPPRESRLMAIVSQAIFEGLKLADEEVGVSDEAVVAAAAYQTLVASFPQLKSKLDNEYKRAMERIGEREDRLRGVQLGSASARKVLEERRGDRADAVEAFDGESREVGFWRRTASRHAPALEPGWGKVRPFVLSEGSQFRPGPPPELSSAVYGKDFEEVLVMGAKESPVRDERQTDVGRFWIAAGPQIWNQAIQQLARIQGLDARETARAFYLLNVAGADGLIAAWDAKFAYRQWRPVTAIRLTEGNPGKVDPDWMTLIETPPFPDYPAGHNTYAGAVATVLTRVFGEEPGRFSLRSHTSGTTHVFESFAAVQEEVENARVWGGAHWRTSCVAGSELGTKVGNAVLDAVGR